MASEKGDGLSTQQAQFTSSQGRIVRYRELLVGRRAGWLRFLAFELYLLLLSGIPGALGLALRGTFLPFFLGRSGPALTIGRSVTVRCPGEIHLGRGVVLDDDSVIDHRDSVALEDENSRRGIFIEDRVLIGRSTLVISKGATITLRRGCNISSFCRIATQSQIEIGPGVLVGAYSYIGPGNHRADDDRPIIEQEMEIRGGVQIGAYSWIGAHTTILDGVTIGEHAIIGAHSLVRDDVPPRAVVAGIPARVIRMRADGEAGDREAADRATVVER